MVSFIKEQRLRGNSVAAARTARRFSDGRLLSRKCDGCSAWQQLVDRQRFRLSVRAVVVAAVDMFGGVAMLSTVPQMNQAVAVVVGIRIRVGILLGDALEEPETAVGLDETIRRRVQPVDVLRDHVDVGVCRQQRGQRDVARVRLGVVGHLQERQPELVVPIQRILAERFACGGGPDDLRPDAALAAEGADAGRDADARARDEDDVLAVHDDVPRQLRKRRVAA
mmetsp:Transcript_2579/g.7032  ORF Transcript_2579/g.7032 Transcript_2579/m.7032 type:complete len:224 (-) Transcript_2579:3181-3852(-)